MFGAPSARFRLYTSPAAYAQVLMEFATQRSTTGPALEELEREIARRVGVRYAVCMPTARTGIYQTLSCLIKPGQKVLMSPITIVDVVNMVLCAGGVPLFIDVEENTCNVDAAEVEKHLGSQNVGAVLITHLHGLACDVERIRQACARAGVPLIEDAAQSFSTQVSGRWTGSFGQAGIYSFGLYKIVNAFYGGMVVTPDEALYQTLKRKQAALPVMASSLYWHKVLFGLATDLGTMPLPFSLLTYWLFRYGYLYQVEALQGFVTVDRHPVRRKRVDPSLLCQMRPLQARLILRQLDGVEANNQSRIQTADAYHKGLADLPSLILPPLRTDGSHIYTYYALRCPDRHALLRYALQHGRDFVLSHYHNCASLSIFKEFYRDCPRAEATAKQLLYLPTYPGYPQSEVTENIRVIRDFCQTTSFSSR